MNNNNDIGIRVKSSLGDSIVGLNSVSASLTNVARNGEKASRSFGNFYKNNKKLNNSFSNMSKDANRASQSIMKLGGNVFNLGNVLKGFSAYQIASVLAKATQANIDMVESINLYNVAMGEYAEVTNVAVESLSKLTGMDITNLQNRVGTYNLLARSMGLANEKSAILSENMNRLSIDLASLTNVSVNQAAQDLRSGLVGQSETMYKYGVDVTEMSLKTEALAHGITKSVRQMTQGEKMVLRYLVTLRQTQLSHGDFAKNIEQPANQLKILSERFVTLSRAIGSLFIPMLAKSLPYINGFVIALTRIIQALALLIGYKPSEEVKNTVNSFSGIEDGADDASTAIGNTGKAIKKLKQSLAGFDEINIIGSKDADSGSKKKEQGSGSPFDIDLTQYDSMLDQVKMKADAIADSLQPKLEKLLKIIGAIGIAFLSWKIGSSIINFMNGSGLFGGLYTLISKIWKIFASPSGEVLKLTSAFGNLSIYLSPIAKKLLYIAGFAGTLAIMVTRFIDLYTNSEKFRQGLIAIIEIGKWISSQVGKLFDFIIGKFVELGQKVYDSLPESWKNGIEKFFGILSKIAKDLDLDFADLLITLGGIALLFTPLAPFGIALLGFEAITVAIRGLGYATSDIIDEFDLFAGVSDETRSKLEPFIEKMNELDNSIKTIQWGQLTLDDATIEDIKSKLQGIVEMITTELDADKNEALNKLKPLKNALGEQAYIDLINANQKYYDDMKDKVSKGEEKILTIINDAQKNGGKLTQEHYDEIDRIRKEMNELGIKHLTETEIEYNTIMNNLKDNSVRISLEQASSIMKNSKETKDKTIDDAKKQYSIIELEAKRMLDVGAINKDQYDSIMKSAKDTKDSTIKDAEEQFGNIEKIAKEKLGESAKYIDWETGEIRSKWDVWAENLKKKADEKFTQIKQGISQWTTDVKGEFERFKTSFGEAWNKFWNGVGNFFIDIWNGITDGFERGLNWIIDGLNDLIGKFNDVAEGIPLIGKKITVSSISRVSFGRIPRLERGGQLSAGQLFEAGEFGKAELVGNFQGKTTVMPLENSGFVDAMRDAVLEGVITALSSKGNDGTPIIIKIGEDTILDTVVSNINRQSDITGENIIKV